MLRHLVNVWAHLWTKRSKHTPSMHSCHTQFLFFTQNFFFTSYSSLTQFARSSQGSYFPFSPILFMLSYYLTLLSFITSVICLSLCPLRTPNIFLILLLLILSSHSNHFSPVIHLYASIVFLYF